LHAIEISDLSFTYENRTTPALDHVNLTVENRESVLLAGASGSGKSTLLKCINGLIPHRYVGQYSGQVNLTDKHVAALDLDELSLIVGTVLQEPDKQLVSSSVEDDVAFGPCNLALPRSEIENRVERSLASMGILQFRERSIFALSGGQKQRLAIAGVLAMEPDIVLFDEPLANLDSNGVKLTQEVLRSLREQGKTMIVAEHRTEEVLRANPTRIVVFDNGRVVADSRDPEILIDFADVLKTPAEFALMKRLPPEKRKIGLDSLLSSITTEQKPAEAPDLGPELVRIENLTFEYSGGIKALHDVSLTIREGERVAILGNNGAGKSTLALSMIGILKPTQGRVLVSGIDTRELPVSEIAKSVGIVFQNPFSMLFAKTVREELAFGPKNLGLAPEEISGLIPQVAEQCTIDHLLDKSPFASSYGEKKRICVGAVLTMRPKSIILDEPTSGQDYRSYSEFMNFICSLSRQVRSLILITHDTDLAIEYTDRAVILRDGRIVADGPTKKILADPKNLIENSIRETSLITLSRRLTHGQSVLPLHELSAELQLADTGRLIYKGDAT
jgi:energy-coupling factor transporter ATP-binding protein EcfA2